MSDYISEDNIVLILKHLPVKALMRFRSVSKWWKQLIDSPGFVQDHLSVQKPRFIVNCGRQYSVIDPRPRLAHPISKPIEKDFILVGTLNGVVCLYETDSDFVIWNPSLHKFSTLRSGFKWCSWGGVRYSFGFWIDSSTKEFKIIVLQRQEKPDMRLQPMIVVDSVLYSSVRRDWSVVPGEKLGNWKSCRIGPPVIVGDVAHWGGCLEDSAYGCDYDHYTHDDKVVLSFDFVQESFELIKMPDVESYKIAPCRWQGALSLVCWDRQLPQNCEIYLRRDDSWVKMFSFKIGGFVTDIFWAMEDMEIKTRKGKGKREMVEMIDTLVGKRENVRFLSATISATENCELLLTGTKSGRKIVMRGPLADQFKVNMAYDFVESLLFPEAME